MKKLLRALSLVLILAMLSAIVPLSVFAADAPKLTSLSLDGGYTLAFDKNTHDYDVFIPAGRPRLPRITATAPDGVKVKVYKAALADSDTTGTAYITLSDGNSTSEYRIRFIRTEKLGFVMQCDDVYTFTPQTLGSDIKFTSSDPSTASVTTLTGNITARKVTDTPVVITATNSQGKTERFVIRRIDKAQIDIVMSTGQSNAYGKGGDASLVDKVRPGTAYDIGYDGRTQTSAYLKNPTPLASTNNTGTGVAGVRQSFADEWYSSTGEKILFINAADPGVKIETWQPNGYAYIGAKKEYDRVKALMVDNEKFEIYREFFYFNHGSADAGGNFNSAYHEMVVKCFDNLFANTDFEFGTIFEYFSSDRDYTTWIRSQHNRIVSEMENIYMGCEMKPYIQADNGLIGSDNLHLTQKGHTLCGRIMAKNTAAQALAPNCKFTSGSSVIKPNDAPALNFDFNGNLTNSAGSISLSLGGGEEKYDSGNTSLVFSDGKTWYSMSDKVKLSNTSDWLVEATFKLDDSTTGFALLGSPDNSAQFYINLSDGKTKGFKIRYGNEGAEGTAITLSVRDTKDFYSTNTWRFYYRSELELLYLFKGNELQSTEILPGSLSISQIGKTGTVSMESKTATIDSLKIFYNAKTSGIYSFAFENNLTEANELITLTSNGNDVYAAESVNLKLSKNDYSFEEITLNKDSDWAVETRGSFSKNSAVLANADGSNTIFANVSDPGFRVRNTSSTYVKLAVGASDFAEIHTWRIEYSASSNTVTLFKDGTKLKSAGLNATLKFSHVGTSGETGTSNAALIDYIKIEQPKVNKGTGDKIVFNFENSLSDDSGNYTLKLEKGSTAFALGNFGYVFSAGKKLSLSQGISFSPANSFDITLRGIFAQNGDIMPNVLKRTENGFEFCGVSFAVENKNLFSIANTWIFKFDKDLGKVSLVLPDGTVLTGAELNGTHTLSELGGSEMTIFSLDIRKISNNSPDRIIVTVSGDAASGKKLTASVKSDIWNTNGAHIIYQWLADGHAIPNANSPEYTPVTNDIGKSISCLAIISGTPESGESAKSSKVETVSEVLPECSESYTPTLPSEVIEPSGSETVDPNVTDPIASDTSEGTEPSEPGKKGCKSSIVSTLSLIMLISLAGVSIKRKRSA